VVGAAHLPGNKGLIELFQAKGYDVKPLRWFLIDEWLLINGYWL
jgi:hypothetical protein